MRRHTLPLLAAAVALLAGCEVGIQHQLTLAPQPDDDQLTLTIHTAGAATDALAAADRLEQLTGTLERATGRTITTEREGDRHRWHLSPEPDDLPDLSALTGIDTLQITDDGDVTATFVAPERLLAVYADATDDEALAAAAAASTELALTVRAPRGVDVTAAPDPVQVTQVGNTATFTVAANQLDTPVTVTAAGQRAANTPWAALAAVALVGAAAVGASRSRRQ